MLLTVVKLFKKSTIKLGFVLKHQCISLSTTIKDVALGFRRGLDRCFYPLCVRVDTKQSWKMTSRVFERLHFEFTTKGVNNLRVLVNSFSKWAEVRVMSSMTVFLTVVIQMTVFAQFRQPEEVLMDGGS